MKRLLVIMSLVLSIMGCDTGFKNGGSLVQSTPTPIKYVVVEIEGKKFMAYQTAYGYWNYTPMVVGCIKEEQQ